LFRRWLEKLRVGRLAARVLLAALPLFALVPHVADVWRMEGLTRAESYLYDLRVRLTTPNTIDSRIVIVDIDERSLAVEGWWPWSRVKIAQLMDQLFDHYGARVVAFDVMFPEPEENSAIRLIDDIAPTLSSAPLRAQLQSRRASFEADRVFAESLIARDVVLGFAFKPAPLAAGEAAEKGALPPPLELSGEALNGVPWIVAAGYVGNQPIHQANASAAGFFDTPVIDTDGVVRRMPLLQQYQGRLYESLALATARLAMGGSALRFAFAPEAEGRQRLEYVALGELRTPVDARGVTLTPFRGPVGSFTYVPAFQVLSGAAPRESLAGKIVLIGTSAAGLNDVRPTPVGSQYVGVEAHANMIAGILDEAALAEPSWASRLTIGLLCFLALLFAFVLPRLKQLAGLALIALLAAGVIGLNWAAWRNAGVVLPLAAPLLYIGAATLLLLNFVYFLETRRKRRLSKIFGQYVPPEIVQDLDANEADVSLEGESREMSVLFSDVRGFTTLSEGLSPRELTQLMNEMLTPLTGVIQSWRGTIDKYMGDAIMAFWGAPLADAAHARNAVLAALDMVDRAAQMRAAFVAKGWPEIHIGVGVSTGSMNVGNMGSKFRMAYTVLGDAVNLGSRLEGLTKQYGVSILVSAATANLVPDVVFREVDRVRVKGKNEPVAIFEPLGLAKDLSSEQIRRAEELSQALAAYRARDFAGALRMILALEANTPENLLAVYRSRIEHFMAHPPDASWDGVFAHETK
jgi:adenylate cyclase